MSPIRLLDPFADGIPAAHRFGHGYFETEPVVDVAVPRIVAPGVACDLDSTMGKGGGASPTWRVCEGMGEALDVHSGGKGTVAAALEDGRVAPPAACGEPDGAHAPSMSAAIAHADS